MKEGETKMKRIFFSTLLAGALMLPAASTVSAAQRGGGRGFASGGRMHGGVGYGHFPGRPYYAVRGPAFGWGYYGYDPFWYGYGYGNPYVVPAGVVTGGLRLEVAPKTAEVFVDGYYAGVVDDFDGHFQHLNLTPGAHQIEVRAPGFQPLTFNTYIQPDHTTDYKATMGPAAGSN
jgi:hypothetical protein